MSHLVRPARDEDLAAMIAMRTEAEQWLRARGVTQWTNDYFDYARDVMASSVEAGTAWVIEHAGEVVATASLSPNADMDFWSAEDNPDHALYLGKMIVSRKTGGHGIGGSILDWACRRASRLGRDWVRIDVRRDNVELHNYYLARQFRHVRTVRPAHRRTESGWLAQRPAGVETHEGPPLQEFSG